MTRQTRITPNREGTLCVPGRRPARTPLTELNTLRSNILSNFASKAVQALGMLVFTPIYVRILGLEAFGLVGLWSTVRAFLILLDFGMSTTLNREIAAARADGSGAGGLWSTLRTLEAISWTIAVAAGVIFALFAPWMGHSWLKLTSMSPEMAVTALIFLGVAATFQLPTILYQGGLTGLERQVSMNGVVVVCSLARDAGAIVVLHLFSTTIVTFFAWQALLSGVQCVAQRVILTRSLPSPESRPSVDLSLLRSFGGFTAGTGLISLTIMFLGLSDGIVLSKFVPLALYGVFSLAQTAAGAILILVSPLTTAAFPRFVAMVVNDQAESMAELFHEFSQLIAVAIYPLATILVAFPGAVLFVWTGKPDIAEQGRVALAIVSLATAFNALLYLPLQAQYAAKWTSLTLAANAVSAVLFVPALILLSARYGIVGASVGLLILMAAQLVIIPPLMYRRLLRGSAARWYLRDLFVPVLPCLALGLVGAFRLHLPTGRLALGGLLFVFWLGLIVATLFCAPQALARIRRFMPRRFRAA